MLVLNQVLLRPMCESLLMAFEKVITDSNLGLHQKILRDFGDSMLFRCCTPNILQRKRAFPQAMIQVPVRRAFAW